MKWIAALLFLAVVADLAAGDPFRLHDLQYRFHGVRQAVVEFSEHLTQSEYREVVDSRTPKH